MENNRLHPFNHTGFSLLKIIPELKFSRKKKALILEVQFRQPARNRPMKIGRQPALVANVTNQWLPTNVHGLGSVAGGLSKLYRF